MNVLELSDRKLRKKCNLKANVNVKYEQGIKVRKYTYRHKV